MKVLYAVDGFEPAVHAGQLLAKIGYQARIGVTVIPPEAYQQSDEVQKLMRNRGQRSADRAAALPAHAGFEVEVQISSGNPDRAATEGGRGWPIRSRRCGLAWPGTVQTRALRIRKRSTRETLLRSPHRSSPSFLRRATGKAGPLPRCCSQDSSGLLQAIPLGAHLRGRRSQRPLHPLPASPRLRPTIAGLRSDP